jgi:hypothetical protein
MKKRYFISQVYDEESEITEAEAFERACYVVCYFSEEKPEYAELIENGEIYRVIYYEKHWPHREDFIARQLSRKDKTPYEIALPSEYLDNEEISKYYCFKAEGEFDFILENHIDSNGNLLSEIHLDENHIAISSTDYEYDETGELLFIREYNVEGKLVSELDYIDSMMPGERL